MADMEVKNLTFKQGMELKVKGVVKPNPVGFSINVGHSVDLIALHFNPRFNYPEDKRTIVLNTKKDGKWEEEQKEKDFPFEAGQEFEVAIVFNFDTFDIYLPNGKMVQFPNRLGDKKYKHIFFVGDAKIQDINVKMAKEINNMTFNPGMELKVNGIVKPNAVVFSINVGHSVELIALHFNPRFNLGEDKCTIVLNTKKDGNWQEEQKEKDFPFEAGQEFEVAIVFKVDTFDIYLPNGNMVQFPNRLGDKTYKHIFFVGDAIIRSMIVKPSSR